MEGWRPVEDVVRWGFAQQPAVMANKDDEWVPMSWHFREMSGIGPFVTDQAVTVAFDDVPPPLDARTGADAVVVSTDNALTEDRA